MEAALRKTGALLGKDLKDLVKNPTVLLGCLLPVGFIALYSQTMGDAAVTANVAPAMNAVPIIATTSAAIVARLWMDAFSASIVFMHASNCRSSRVSSTLLRMCRFRLRDRRARPPAFSISRSTCQPKQAYASRYCDRRALSTAISL